MIPRRGHGNARAERNRTEVEQHRGLARIAAQHSTALGRAAIYLECTGGRIEHNTAGGCQGAEGTCWGEWGGIVAVLKVFYPERHLTPRHGWPALLVPPMSMLRFATLLATRSFKHLRTPFSFQSTGTARRRSRAAAGTGGAGRQA